MDKADAAQLLGYCAAFDNRTVGRVDATAWAAALRDVPCDGDALDAVARYYGTAPERPGERLWIQPHHVRAGRLAIRKERLGDTLPAYVPPPGPETGAESAVRRRAQIDAVATGRTVGEPVGRLTGPPPPEFVAELRRRFGESAAIGAYPEDDEEPQPSAEAIAAVRRPGPLGVECPQCGAAIGRPCRIGFPSGDRQPRPLKIPHSARARVARGEPAGLESPEEIERRRAVSLARLEQMVANSAAAS
ncbi:hypothetical protein OHT52_21265 [Streptomyces sp. NBC_00247]|uniref:zinc finger domain-containing protein n=1 Tax=Streptomyces sp. NBC_00247 TaxID=2975689 RepID=UPI002E2DAE20|nr:hypothetical protein [Streptomyces sp. NBC_00247]